MASPPEEQRNREDSPTTKELLHKTKLIQFLGRNSPIVLQNDNGPCPLLAICNVLLLRNNLNLSSDVAEVSQEKLLSLVAERLIDSNSNVNNKDAGYVENQQQNIADAIDLLPRLTTGIDVNIKFTRIDDFEFTRECAIFDLLDIPLYHGWIVDPQDSDTSNAIGLKSYNTLMGELVALETQNPASESKNSEEDSVDFVAATTASLGVPSPSLSRAKSFDDSPRSDSKEQKERKGDLLEEEELMRALKLSETDSSPMVENNPSEDLNDSSLKKQEEQEHKHNDDLISFETVPGEDVCSSSEGVHDKQNGDMATPSEKHDSNDEIKKTLNDESDSSEKHDSKDEVEKTSDDVLVKSEKSDQVLDESGPSEKQDSKAEIKKTNDDVLVKSEKADQVLGESDPSEKHDSKDEIKKTSDDVLVKSEKAEVLDEVDPSEKHDGKDEIKKTSDDMLVKSEQAEQVSDESDPSKKHESKDEKIQDESISKDDVNELGNNETVGETSDISSSSAPIAGFESSKEKNEAQTSDESKSLTSSGDGSEPIYEGEECIHETSTTNPENREPMYEGEVVLAEQVDKVSSSADETKPKDGITPRQGELIRNFLKNSANQLTIYGLFSLQEGLKERELCVFFRNNHFNTMFKFEGELYLLATDQGYINQPDLVWEKLNEVNGDTVFMTSNFKEFNAENPEPRSWNEQNALANTAEYLASIDNTTQETTGFNSDLQLAIALQQQEFEQQQQQQQPQRNLPQPNPTGAGESRLVTGPQHVQPSRPKSSSSSSKHESKSSKEKCTIM